MSAYTDLDGPPEVDWGCEEEEYEEQLSDSEFDGDDLECVDDYEEESASDRDIDQFDLELLDDYSRDLDDEEQRTDEEKRTNSPSSKKDNTTNRGAKPRSSSQRLEEERRGGRRREDQRDRDRQRRRRCSPLRTSPSKERIRREEMRRRREKRREELGKRRIEEMRRRGRNVSNVLRSSTPERRDRIEKSNSPAEERSASRQDDAAWTPIVEVVDSVEKPSAPVEREMGPRRGGGRSRERMDRGRWDGGRRRIRRESRPSEKGQRTRFGRKTSDTLPTDVSDSPSTSKEVPPRIPSLLSRLHDIPPLMEGLSTLSRPPRDSTEVSVQSTPRPRPTQIQFTSSSLPPTRGQHKPIEFPTTSVGWTNPVLVQRTPRVPVKRTPIETPSQDPPRLPVRRILIEAPTQDPPRIPVRRIPIEAPTQDLPRLTVGRAPIEAPTQDPPRVPVRRIPIEAPTQDLPRLTVGRAPIGAPIQDPPPPRLPVRTPIEAPTQRPPRVPIQAPSKMPTEHVSIDCLPRTASGGSRVATLPLIRKRVATDPSPLDNRLSLLPQLARPQFEVLSPTETVAPKHKRIEAPSTDAIPTPATRKMAVPSRENVRQRISAPSTGNLLVVIHNPRPTTAARPLIVNTAPRRSAPVSTPTGAVRKPIRRVKRNLGSATLYV